MSSHPGFLHSVAISVWTISDQQQSWGYEDGPWKGPGPPVLVATDYMTSLVGMDLFIVSYRF
jgi:hypothetical protein